MWAASFGLSLLILHHEDSNPFSLREMAFKRGAWTCVKGPSAVQRHLFLRPAGRRGIVALRRRAHGLGDQPHLSLLACFETAKNHQTFHTILRRPC